MSAKTIFLLAAGFGLLYLAFRAKKNVDSLFASPATPAAEAQTGTAAVIY